MKTKLNLSPRDKWLVALLPALLIVGLYAFVISDMLTAELKKQQGRVAANASVVSAAPSGSGLAKARAEVDKAREALRTRERQIDDLEAQLASLKTPPVVPEDHEPARVIERIDAIFARNGVTPLISEAVGDRNSASQESPTALLNVLSPKAEPGIRPMHVWHYVFDDVTPRLRQAVEELTRNSASSVVPLSLNFVFNPDNDGQTHLLELWLLY